MARPAGRVRPRAGVRPLGLTDSRDPLILGPTPASYHVRYEEFPGGHEVPRWLATEAVVWLCESLPSEGTS